MAAAVPNLPADTPLWWRVRLEGENIHFPCTPWFWMSHNPANETDVVTLPGPKIFGSNGGPTSAPIDH